MELKELTAADIISRYTPQQVRRPFFKFRLLALKEYDNTSPKLLMEIIGKILDHVDELNDKILELENDNRNLEAELESVTYIQVGEDTVRADVSPITVDRIKGMLYKALNKDSDGRVY